MGQRAKIRTATKKSGGTKGKATKKTVKKSTGKR